MLLAVAAALAVVASASRPAADGSQGPVPQGFPTVSTHSNVPCGNAALHNGQRSANGQTCHVFKGPVCNASTSMPCGKTCIPRNKQCTSR